MNRKLPAYPLFIKDPNFSLWSVTEKLNASNIQTWFGEEKNIYGFVKIQGVTYCFMGNSSDFYREGVIPATQEGIHISLFATEYVFKCGDNKLSVHFVSPLPLNDLDLLSLPVAYVRYELDCDGEISFFVNKNIAFNKHTLENNALTMSFNTKKFQVSCVGLKRQLPLSNNDDMCGADWGYYYLSGEHSYKLKAEDVKNYLKNGVLVVEKESEAEYIASINNLKNGIVMLGYDDTVSINYFGRCLKGYYLEKHDIFEGLDFVFAGWQAIERQLADIETEINKKSAIFGNEYKQILNAAYRQCVGAHKLVRDENGDILFLSKECGSNGCIATVDISYPSMPLFLLYNTELIKGMLRPIFKFAKMPVWRYNFAPHDAGAYPFCCGQVYGIKNDGNDFCGNIVKNGGFQTYYPLFSLPENIDIYNENRQMPIEENANILIMLYACFAKDGDISFFEKQLPLCKAWADYLVKFGLKPASQLCTDDFGGHLEKNINLAIKATIAIMCFSKLLNKLTGEGAQYEEIAVRFANEINEFSDTNGHLPLTWDSGNNTYSLKYNLVFDKIFGFKLFDEKLFKREIKYYISCCNRYGIPLDSRKEYTKSDWIMWTAYFAEEDEQKKHFIHPICEFLKTSPDRIPFSDWFDTQEGSTYHFRARSVQGGCFILLLKGLERE